MDEKTPPSLASWEPLPITPNKTATLMVVDDDEMILEVMSEMLALLNYKVIRANNGKKALHIYKADIDAIDLIILDIMMPGLTGDMVFDRLKELNPDVKVICASGYCARKTIKKMLSGGLCGFFSKPINITELSRHVQKILKT